MKEFPKIKNDFINETVFSTDFFGQLQAECYHRIENIDDANNLKIEFENIIMSLDRIKENLLQCEKTAQHNKRLSSVGIDLRKLNNKQPIRQSQPIVIPKFLQTGGN